MGWDLNSTQIQINTLSDIVVYDTFELSLNTK